MDGERSMVLSPGDWQRLYEEAATQDSRGDEPSRRCRGSLGRGALARLSREGE